MTKVTQTPAPYYRTSPEGFPMGAPQEGTHLVATGEHGVTRELDIASTRRVIVGVASLALRAQTAVAAKRHIALETGIYSNDK